MDNKLRDNVQDYFHDAFPNTLVEVIKFLGNQCRIAMNPNDFSVLERRTKEIFESHKKRLPVNPEVLKSRLPPKPFPPIGDDK